MLVDFVSWFPLLVWRWKTCVIPALRMRAHVSFSKKLLTFDRAKKDF